MVLLDTGIRLSELLDEIALPSREVKAKEFHREVHSSFKMDQFAAAQLFGSPVRWTKKNRS
jgi:hypothetical protein